MKVTKREYGKNFMWVIGRNNIYIETNNHTCIYPNENKIFKIFILEISKKGTFQTKSRILVNNLIIFT